MSQNSQAQQGLQRLSELISHSMLFMKMNLRQPALENLQQFPWASPWLRLPSAEGGFWFALAPSNGAPNKWSVSLVSVLNPGLRWRENVHSSSPSSCCWLEIWTDNWNILRAKLMVRTRNAVREIASKSLF